VTTNATASTVTQEDPQLRVLLRTATSKDAVMATAVLERAGIATRVCATLQELVLEIGRARAPAGLRGNAVGQRRRRAVQRGVDAAALVGPAGAGAGRQGADSRAIAVAMEGMANVTVLERPIRVAALVSALRSALRARRRQYELRRILDDLSEADKRKTEFLATLAHELRNPMAPLSTALAILTRKTLTPEAALPYYQLMGRQIDHMVRLVNDLMEVSRITRGKIELQLGELKINQVIRDAVELSRPLMDAGRHRLPVHAAMLRWPSKATACGSRRCSRTS
jgi:signal transduction histidine kinase